ncbi:MAG: hypothetical protein HY353_03510 [Candidatus Omnitrophica bacterium]|nr:hypothetical protein [Candidatus Omnitrophota bacterium]
MAAVTKSLIETLQQAIPFVELREASPDGGYFEGVLARSDLERCCQLLGSVLGPAAKEFGKTVRFAKPSQAVVDHLGGIRPDQCLFLKEEPSQPIVFAALWPWASNPDRITLKLGVFPRSD